MTRLKERDGICSREFRADSTPPHVLEAVPAMGATEGYPDEPVVAWLDEPFAVLVLSALEVKDVWALAVRYVPHSILDWICSKPRPLRREWTTEQSKIVNPKSKIV